jgi:hypothetical protein
LTIEFNQNFCLMVGVEFVNRDGGKVAGDDGSWRLGTGTGFADELVEIGVDGNDLVGKKHYTQFCGTSKINGK